MVDIPSALSDAVMTTWDLVEDQTLEQAYALFTEGLVTRPHDWAKGYVQLDAEASTGLDDERIIRLALLALGELPTNDQPRWNRARTQPWFRAYVLLYDLCLDQARFVSLSPEIAWLAIDALMHGLQSDDRHNGEQIAASWISTALTHRNDDPRLAEQRMLSLVEQTFEADGYDTGSMDFDLRDLAVHIDDPRRASELRLMHAYLSYATEPWDEHSREQLALGLRTAPTELDVATVRDACMALMGRWSADPLPLTVEAIPPLS